MDIDILEVDLSQKEKTLQRSDKGKILVIESPSSYKGKYSMEDTLRWLRKEEMVRHKSQLYCTKEEGMGDLIKALKKPKSPIGDA